MEDRLDWHQNDMERAQTTEIITRLEAAIVATKPQPEYVSTDRRKVARETRRQTLARVLVNLNTALANLAASGSLDDSAKLWLIEGLDAACVLTMDGYFDAKGKVTIPEWRLGSNAPVAAQSAPPVAPDMDGEL
jgi:hypothetical protein